MYPSVPHTLFFTKAFINMVFILQPAEVLKEVGNEGRGNRRRKSGFTLRKDGEHNLWALEFYFATVLLI